MKWAPVDPTDLEPGDFIRKNSAVFKVRGINGERIELEGQSGKIQRGTFAQLGSVEVRTEDASGQPTTAGKRLGEDFEAISALLRDKLDAELIGWQSYAGSEKKFVPWQCEEFGPKSDTKALASHLFMCHGIETESGLKGAKELGRTKFAEQRASLLEAHDAAHALDAAMRYDGPRRLPHVHHNGR